MLLVLRTWKNFNKCDFQDIDLFTAGVSEIPLPGRLLGNQLAVIFIFFLL